MASCLSLFMLRCALRFDAVTVLSFNTQASLMAAVSKTAADFTTTHGKTVADAVLAARQRLGLDEVVGCSAVNIVRQPNNATDEKNLYDFYMYVQEKYPPPQSKKNTIPLVFIEYRGTKRSVTPKQTSLHQ